MSYSFSVSGASKTEVKKAMADSFDSVVKNQPSHAADREAAVAAGSAMVDVLKDPADGQEFHVSMHGSLGWVHDAPGEYIGAGVNVSASLRAKPAA